MKFHHRQGVANLSDLCVKNGLRHIVIAPGSRNAPLIFSFTNHPDIKTYSITDERSAAYFALGLSLKYNEPVGVVCTSGTATLNFIPAVAEAFYQHIPLIIFTADRPKELIDQFDGQTINQTNIYQNFVCKSLELPVETEHADDLWYFNRIISEGINDAKFHALPCHINVPLREPLYDKLPTIQSDLKAISTDRPLQSLTDDSIHDIQAKWKAFPKKMIICGFQLPDDALRKELIRLNEDPDLVIINENLANVQIGQSIECPDLLFRKLLNDDKKDFSPDLLITIGGSIISKVLKQYLRKHTPTEHWNIDPYARKTDTFKSLNRVIPVTARKFMEILPGSKKSNLNYKERMLADYQNGCKIRNTYVNSLSQMSDLFAINQLNLILNEHPRKRTIHLSNSMTVRYMQLFDIAADTYYFCNRGTSGIDGSTSTAAGYAMNDTIDNLLITGDLAFLYDSNILQHPNMVKNLKIIILNNQGGNIFEIINKEDRLEGVVDYFTTPQHVDIKQLCSGYNINHQVVENQKECRPVMEEFIRNQSTPCVLEIRTDSKSDTETIKTLYSNLNQ